MIIFFKIINIMSTHCLKCKKVTKDINPKILKTKNKKLRLSSKCGVCSSNKSRILSKKEGKGLISNLTGKKIPILSDIPILNLLF